MSQVPALVYNASTGGFERLPVGESLSTGIGVSPVAYGAVGNGSSNPASGKFSSLAACQAVYLFATSLYQELDWLAWQAALNAGGLVETQPLHFIMCNANVASMQPLTAVAGQSWVNGCGSILDFSALTPQTSNVHYIQNYNFATSANWVNASIYSAIQITNTIFGSGAATYTDPAPYTSFTGVIAASVLTVSGFSGSPAIAVGSTIYGVFGTCTVASFGTGTGGNGTYNVTGATTASSQAMSTSTGHFCQFGQQVTLQPGKYRAICTFSATLGASFANGNPNGPNAGIQFFASSPGNGANFCGRTAGATNLSGVFSGTVTQTIEFDFLVTTATTAWLTFSGGGYANFSITNFDIQAFIPNCGLLLTRDGAVEHYPISQPFGGVELIGPGSGVAVTGVLYKSFSDIDGNLINMESNSIHGWGTGVVFSDGAYLTEFTNVGIFANGTCISYQGGVNSGENFKFFGGGLFNSAVGVNNAGGCEMTFVTTGLDYNTQAIINNYGRIELHGCHLEMDVPATAGYPLFSCYGTGTINWFGGMFLGAGGVGTAAEPPIHLDVESSAMTFYGTQIYNLSSAATVAMTGAGILSAYGWLNSGNPNIGLTLLSQSANMDAFGGAGSFEPVSSPFPDTDPTGIGLPGGIYPAGGTTTNQWTSSQMAASISTDYAHSGTHSLKIVRSVGLGGGDDQLLIPIFLRSGQNAWASIWFLFPNNVGTGTTSLYMRLWWAQIVGYDAYGRPIMNQTEQFKGEFDITVPLGGSSTWQHWTANSAYSNGGSQGAPPWANCFCINMDTESLPAMTFYMDDLQANIL